jgi:hypothetical protein
MRKTMHRAENRTRTGVAATVAAMLVVVLASARASTPAPAAPSTPPVEPHGSVTLEPGYVPPNDPESSSVRVGRRVNAPLVSKPFTGGARSLEELGRKVCHALDYESPDTLFSLAVQQDEFRDILWPEFPMSRPATGITWQDGWMFLYGRLHQGSAIAIRDYGGHVYQFIRFDRSDSTMRYKNFKLHNGLVLVAKDDEGKTHEFHWLRTVVERKGRFKIYSMTD